MFIYRISRNLIQLLTQNFLFTHLYMFISLSEKQNTKKKKQKQKKQTKKKTTTKYSTHQNWQITFY